MPAYALTDNEKTVTAEHLAGIAVRNPEIVQVAALRDDDPHLPADPQSKGRVGEHREARQG